MRSKKAKDIGLEVKLPAKDCADRRCPFHGQLSVRGNIIRGEVVSIRAQKTVVIKRGYQHYLPKYERYERRSSRIAAYKPECIEVKEGDRVTIAECRPLSKTKHFVVVENLERSKK